MGNGYNYNIHNQALTQVVVNNPSINQPNTNSVDLISVVNNTAIVKKAGIIETIYPVNDGMFATIRKNYAPEFTSGGDQLDHGEGWFNVNDGTDPTTLTIADFAIRTNISAINSLPDRYVGMPCIVTVKDGIAVFAEVNTGSDYLTSFSAKTLKDVRSSLGPTIDLFSEEGRQALQDRGYSVDQIDDLSKLKYTNEQQGKVVTFSGEAVWSRDTAKLGKDQLELTAVPIIPDLNALGMKTKDCHLPTRLFSGK